MSCVFKEHYRGKVIAITGSTGYIGSAIIERLLELDAIPMAVSRLNIDDKRGIQVISGDIEEYLLWENVIKSADFIFHLAGNTSSIYSQNNSIQSLHSTLKPISQLIKAVNAQKKRFRVVYASTATIYGLSQNLPIDENVQPSPITYYDLHKFFAEQELRMGYELNKNCEYVCLRLGNVYGFGQMARVASDRGVLNKVAKLAIEGKEIIIYGDGSSIRDYIHLKDVVDAFLYAGISKNIQGESYNISSGVGIQLIEAFKKIQKEVESTSGIKSEILHRSWPDSTLPIEFRDYYANIEKFSKITGWKPKVKFEDGIKKMIRDLLAYQKNFGSN